MQPLYKRILIKLSGEGLMGDKAFGMSPDVLEKIAKDIKKVHDLDVEICIVVGGGNIFRGAKEASEGINRSVADQVGMLGTVMNALYVQDALEKIDIPCRVMSGLNVPQVCEPYMYRKALKHLSLGRVVIFAGGTGMYLHAYFVGMDDLPPSTPQTRATLNELLQTQGKEGLHRALHEKDPVSAAQIPVGNVQRTMRALELCLLTGKPASTLKSGSFFKLPDAKKSHWVLLDWEKDTLHARIKTRTEQIFDGMVQEAQTLLDEGFGTDTAALKTLGYPQALAYLQGTLTRAQAAREVALKTRQYAKRQRTWFNRYTQAQRLGLSTPEDFDIKKLAQAILARAS